MEMAIKNLINKHLEIIKQLPANYDGQGSCNVPEEKINSVIELIEKYPVLPNDIYPTPDGNLVVEWQYKNGRIDRLEVEEAGKGEWMLTTPGEPAKFFEYFW